MARSGPGWMMLDRFVFRRDDAKEDGWPLRAASRTSLGKRFDVAFLPAEPPAISRLYVRWPGGTKPEDGNGTDLVASHRDLVLFRLTSIEKLDEYPYLRHTQDHFICIASSEAYLRLKRLPVCTAPLVLPSPKEGKEDIIMQRVFFPHTVGLLCRGEEFTVAQLTMISEISGSRMVEAQVCVLHSRVSADDDDGKWEVKKLLVQHSEADEYSDLYYWSTDAVITFKNCICWVNYYRGGILFYQVFQERPNISYLRLPMNNRPFDSSQAKAFLEMNRSVCVTEGGKVLKFINVAREDGELFGPIRPGSSFTITSYILRTTESGDMKWDKDVVMTSYQLWSRNTSECLPRNILMFPLVSMDEPHVVHFLLSEEGDEIDKVSVVTIDMITKTVDSIVPYINGVEDLHGEDADMVGEKSHLLKSFLPSEFPKFLKLTREQGSC